MKKYFCKKCNKEKDIKDVQPQIDSNKMFTDPAKPEIGIINYPIVCRACGSVVLEKKLS